MMLKALASCALALALLGTFPLRASAQSSCSGWLSKCTARCNDDQPSSTKSCMSEFCRPKFAECRQSGCWREYAVYGGALHCNLKKS